MFFFFKTGYTLGAHWVGVYIKYISKSMVSAFLPPPPPIQLNRWTTPPQNTRYRYFALGGPLAPSCLECTVIFALKRNEAKRKRNLFRFDAKKSAFFICFALMQNVEIWSETKMKRTETETKKKQNFPSFSLWSEMKRNRSKIVFALMRKRCFSLVFSSEAKRKLDEAKTKPKRS
jgi:hypothetical protein